MIPADHSATGRATEHETIICEVRRRAGAKINGRDPHDGGDFLAFATKSAGAGGRRLIHRADGKRRGWKSRREEQGGRDRAALHHG